jgi:hypothetical protein
MQSLATVLAGFENLRELRLPGVNNLDMGLVKDIFCGNAYDGVSGTKMGIFELLESMSVTEKAVKIVLEELPDLEVICLGSLCANIEYRKPPAWPWTGRVRDYIMESWPRYRGSIHHSSEHEDPDGPVFSTTEEDKEWLEGGKQPGDLDIIQSWEDQWGYDDIQHEEL